MTRCAVLFLILLLTSCDSGEPNKITLDEYEGPLGEVAARHLIAHLPPLQPDVPKVYCIVKGPRLENTHMDFATRMKDLNLQFVSSLVLQVREPDKNPIDPHSRLSPVMLQLALINRTGKETYEVIAGWAYLKTWERRRYTLHTKGDGYEITKDERIEGNYTPPG